jgi:hypothetical protein
MRWMTPLLSLFGLCIAGSVSAIEFPTGEDARKAAPPGHIWFYHELGKFKDTTRLRAEARLLRIDRSGKTALMVTDPGPKLLLFNIDSQHQRVLMNLPNVPTLWIDLSPDGKIAAATDGRRIWVTETAKSAPRRILALKSGLINDLTIAPDNSAVYFLLNGTPIPTNWNQAVDRGVYKVALANNHVSQVVTTQAAATALGMAPAQISHFGASHTGSGLALSANVISPHEVVRFHC